MINLTIFSECTGRLCCTQQSKGGVVCVHELCVKCRNVHHCYNSIQSLEHTGELSSVIIHSLITPQDTNENRILATLVMHSRHQIQCMNIVGQSHVLADAVIGAVLARGRHVTVRY